MATITRSKLAAYRRAVQAAQGNAAEAARRALARWDAANPAATVEQAREAAIRIAQAAVDSYGGAASSASCALFDSVMEAEGVNVGAARMASTAARRGAVEGTVHRVAGALDGSPESFEAFSQAIGQLASREVKLAADLTVEQNVERATKTRAGRRVRYARVPGGADPCAWCAMLASRGFVYMSAESASAASHHHCSCSIVPGVSGSTKVDGYDPGYYKGVWASKR